MSLEVAIAKAWDNLPASLSGDIRVRFLADEYFIDRRNLKVMPSAANALADDSRALLILHYLAQKLNGLPALTGEWIGFSSLSVIESFAEVFRKRATDRLLGKYGNNPDNILSVLKTIPGKKISRADAAIVIEAFEDVPLLIELLGADEEFGPEANILFDSSITRIFCVEDIVALAEMVAEAL